MKTFQLTSKPYFWIYAGGIILLLLTFGLWWVKVYTAPRHVFWSMLETSLSTKSVVVETTQVNGADHAKQLVHVDTGLADKAHSLTVLKQGPAEVKTEIIGTRQADYTRYQSIKSARKADVSSVVKVWSKSDDQAQTATQASGHQLLAQAVLGIGLPIGSTPVPMGEVTPEQRAELMEFIRSNNLYKPSFQTVKKERKNGQLRYTYDVQIETILYVSLMKQFAKYHGFGELEGVDPNKYSGAPPLTARLTVDAHSHHLVAVNFGDKNFTQKYMAYGLPLKVSVPKKTISAAELQRRLDKLHVQNQPE